MDTLKELQGAILKVAKEIHRICVDHHIKYFMLGGTFIGAVRHRGFIPWDDDIDFGMTYDQYLRFIHVAKTLQHEWLVFDFPEYENKDYANLFIKAYDRNTTLVEHDKPNDVRGVFVDIFPVLPARDTKEACLKEMRLAVCLRRLLQCKRYNLYEHRPVVKRLMQIVSRITPRRLIFYLAERQIASLATEGRKFHIAPDGTKKDIYDTRYFKEEYILYPFEDTQFYGIKDYDHYLTDVFRDYMTLPPEDRRNPHHLNYVDLDRPFATYNQQQRDK